MAEHYFSPSPGAEDRRSSLTVTLGGRDVAVQTAAGVFSAERLDLGTRVLLREVPAPPATGDLLDLGCGWGPIALTMGIQAPASTVWAIDVNQRALALTARNAAALGLTRIRACGPYEVPGHIEFAAIWSNPPIRVGKQELHALLLRWLPRLAAGGQAHLVVMRNLGADSLHRWLSQTLTAEFTVERAASAKGYRVLRVTRRTPEGQP